MHYTSDKRVDKTLNIVEGDELCQVGERQRTTEGRVKWGPGTTDDKVTRPRESKNIIVDQPRNLSNLELS